jgi:thiamine-monophosphate kinase
MHEFDFINWLKGTLNRPADRGRVPVGIGDDMAVLNFQGGNLLFGSDLTIEHVHFEFSTATPQQVGHKALGRCLSDCAAMAGLPLAAIVSIAKPKSMPEKILKDIYRGMFTLARRYGCPIVGGDTSSSPQGLVIDVSLLGKRVGKKAILRSGARPGDYLYVTGPLGGSILGKHLKFQPRIPEAQWLMKNLPLHALIDISDGLSSDLGHLCEESGCGAELSLPGLEKIISPAARTLAKKTKRPALTHALNDGEDFELLAAIPMAPEQLPRPTGPVKVKLLAIGKVTRAKEIHVVSSTGGREKLLSRGFVHF